MAEYIERKKVKEALLGWDYDPSDDDVECAINHIPAADVVSREVFEQVKWERDTALQTLQEHGIGLGEKADVVEVVRCKDCKHYEIGKSYTPYCNNVMNLFEEMKPTDFCSYGERKKGDENEKI